MSIKLLTFLGLLAGIMEYLLNFAIVNAVVKTTVEEVIFKLTHFTFLY